MASIDINEVDIIYEEDLTMEVFCYFINTILYTFILYEYTL